MRICHVIESTSGGSVRAALALAQGQAVYGEDVTLIYSSARADNLFRAQLGQLSNVRTHVCDMKRSVGPHDAWALFKLAALLRKAGPFDIVHAHSSKAGALVRLAGPFVPRVRIVYTPHAFVTMAPGVSRLYGMIERLLSFGGDAIIAVSQAEKEHALSVLHIAPRKVTVIPNGLDLPSDVSRMQARERIGYDDKAIILGFVGRLSAQKNPLRLIDAFERLSASYPALRLAIIGDGELTPVVEQAVVARGLDKRIRFWHGQDARLFMPGFDALVCSSDYEGLPLTFIEALQVGVPILTTPVGGSHEAVLPGETGFVAEDLSVGALDSTLRCYLMLTDQAREAMSAHARRHAQNFSVEAMVRRTQNLYLSLLVPREPA